MPNSGPAHCKPFYAMTGNPQRRCLCATRRPVIAWAEKRFAAQRTFCAHGAGRRAEAQCLPARERLPRGGRMDESMNVAIERRHALRDRTDRHEQKKRRGDGPALRTTAASGVCSQKTPSRLTTAGGRRQMWSQRWWGRGASRDGGEQITLAGAACEAQAGTGGQSKLSEGSPHRQRSARGEGAACQTRQHSAAGTRSWQPGGGIWWAVIFFAKRGDNLAHRARRATNQRFLEPTPATLRRRGEPKRRFCRVFGGTILAAVAATAGEPGLHSTARAFVRIGQLAGPGTSAAQWR